MKNCFNRQDFKVFNFTFWLLIILSLFSILNIFCINKYNIQAKNSYNTPLENIVINVDFKRGVNTQVLACFEDYCTSLNPNLFKTTYDIIFSYENDYNFREKPIKNIHLLFPSDFDFNSYVKLINVNVGDKNYYYQQDDILKFENKELTVELGQKKKKQKYDSVKLPKVNSYKGIIKHFSIFILSLFNDSILYIIPFFWLFVASLIYIFKKEDISVLKFNNFHKWLIYLLFGIGILLRLAFVDYQTLLDEKMFTNFEIIKNILPIIFNILSIFVVYKFFKRIDRNIAIFSLFYTSLNLVMISYSNMALMFSFSSFLVVSLIYFLREYIVKKDVKNLIPYIILSIIAINVNFYLLVFVVGNFIYGLVSLFEDKNKKEVLKFSLLNIIPFLIFIPNFIINNKEILNDTFNIFIRQFNEYTFINIINMYFSNKYIFIIFLFLVFLYLVLIYLPKNILSKLNLKINKKKENLFIYSIYSITFILILLSLVSVFYKPILNTKLLYIFYPLLLYIQIILIVTVFDLSNIKSKYKAIKLVYSLILILLCFNITKPMIKNDIDMNKSFIEFILNDIKQYKNTKTEIVVVSNLEDKYIEKYPEIKQIKNIKWHYIDTNKTDRIKKLTRKDWTKNSNSIIYTNNSIMDIGRNAVINPLIKTYHINSSIIYKLNNK